MTRRGTTARSTSARGRPARRRRRTGGAGPGWWPLAAAVAVAAVGYRLWEALAAIWPLLVVAGAALAAVAATVLLIRRREQAYRWRVLQGARVDLLGPRQFERLTAELLRRDGFRGVRVLGGAGDRGVDVVGTAPDGTRYAIQCKRYTTPVGPGPVREFIGALQSAAYRGHRGVLVTSHHLSRQAAETAAESGLLVIDRDRLADWLRGAYTLAPGRTRFPAVLRWPRRGGRAPGNGSAPAARPAGEDEAGS